ncbi:MAG TPA: hypothetical protein VI387_03770, partial [Candidatus Brocadiales bacterium]|nr:hypothetical protein [Candidatus Brocadiales bacterium]
LRLVLRHVDNNRLETDLTHSRALCNTVEAEVEIEKTEVHRVGEMVVAPVDDWSEEEKEDIIVPIFLIEADKTWLKAPPLLSFYTFILRAGNKYQGGEWREFLNKGKFKSENDTEIAELSEKFWDKYITKDRFNIYKSMNIKTGYPNINDEIIHHQFGFSSIGRVKLKDIYDNKQKQWQEKWMNGTF